MMAALLIVVVWLTSTFNVQHTTADLPSAPAAPAILPTFKPTATPTPGIARPSTMKLIGQRQIVPAAYGSPTGLVLDRRGSLYVIDAVHAHILKYDRGGRPVMQWGSAGSGDGQFQFIRPNTTGGLPVSDILGDVAVDRLGNVYVADTGNARIQKFSGDGQYLLKWNGGAGADHLYQPVRLAIDSQNEVYVLDANSSAPQVHKFDSQGTGLLSWNIPVTGTGTSVPVGLALDAEDRVYVLDDVTNELFRFDRTGKLRDVWIIHCGSNQLTDLDVGPTGNIYIGEAYSQVCEYDSSGQFTATWTKPDVEFLGVNRLAVDPLGSIYLSDSRNGRIQHFALP
jgi:DNA-binding beta-propeller fold protein YncE